jgi:hypothetical protein
VTVRTLPGLPAMGSRYRLIQRFPALGGGPLRSDPRTPYEQTAPTQPAAP